MRHPEARPSRLVVPFVLLLALAVFGVVAPAGAQTTTRLTGRVIDSDTQAPIAKADVELANLGGGQGYFRARTNARGEFSIDRIAPGRWYTLTVGADGYADFVLGGWQFPKQQRAVDLVVPLDRAGTLEVKATKSDGKTAVAGAKVNVMLERGDTWWEGYRPPPPPLYTDARGIATFAGLSAGSYAVNVDVSGLRPADVRRIAVRRGETTKLPIALVRPASLSGTVKLADGSPVGGVAVTARGPGEAVGTTDEEGNFAVGDLAPGRYRLDVSSDGLQPTASKTTYTLSEGGSRDDIALVATPKPPEFAFVVEREAFLPDATIKLGLRSFRVGAIDVTVYRVPEARLFDATKDFRSIGADSTGLERVTAWTHVVGQGPDWSWREGELVIPEPLAPGAYVVRGRSGSMVRAQILFVTDLGLVVKRSATKLLVATASTRDGRPVADARVYAIANPSPPLSEGSGWPVALAERRGVPPVRTSANGLVTIPTPGGVPATSAGTATTTTRLRIVAIAEDHGIAVADAPLAPAAERGGDQLFLYTDRPIYRPGHTVYWKAFVRTARGDTYQIPDATAVNLSLQGPDGASVEVPPAQASRHGTADGAVSLPSELPLGDWTLSASAAGARGTATVAVQEYRKPEFRVEATPDREVFVNGDEVRFRIAATYFFGSPVFGANVRYNLFETRLESRDDTYGYDEEQGRGYGRVLKTGETRTDLDGRAEVVFTPERVAYDRRLTLEVEVVDASNRSVSGRGSAIMGRGLFTVAVTPRAYVVDPGAPVPIDVTTRDHTGKPVSAAVTVTLDQEAWNPITRRYTRSTRPLASATVTTDRTGRASLSLKPGSARPGQILVKAQADDVRGNRITAQASVWAWDPGVSEYSYRYPALEVLADRERYAAGDTVRVLVNTDVRNAQVLATLEGRDLYDAQAFTLSGGTGLVTFVVKPEYAPNAFVSVHVRKGREVVSRTVEIDVAAERHDLKITLTPDRERYGPGDSARVQVETRDGQGRALPAEVSLAVVDEAIFSLRADDTPDPHAVFYGRKPNWVSTTVAFPSLLLGGVDKGEREAPRRDFRDVALWAPTITTGADGRGGVAFRYPDNLTTWRFTSRGITDATQVGKAVTSALVTKDLVARLAGPRFFVAGDQASLVSVVTNRSENPIADGTTTLEVTGAERVGAGSAPLSASAKGEARAEWRLKIADPARDSVAVLTLRARSKTDSDALEVAVPIRPRAVALAITGAGLLEASTRTVSVALPSNLVRTGSGVTIDLSPSAAGLAVSGADYLLAYPYGCTEQTSNAVIAATALVQAMRKAGVTAPGWENPERRLAEPLRHLAANQLQDGGWGWWKDSEFDPYLTALAIDALARAVKLEIAPSEARDALSRASGQIGRIISEARSADGEAYVLGHVAAAVASGDATTKGLLNSVADNLVASQRELGNTGLALAIQGLVSLDRTTHAKQLAAALIARGTKDGAGLHWSPDPDDPSVWFGDDLDATGHALAALSRATPDDAKLTDVVRWLAARRTGMSWRTTRATGPVCAGIADYAGAHAAELKPNYKLRVDWNGESVFERAVTPADAFAGRGLRVTIPAAKLKPGDNRLGLTRQGSGSLYYGWEAKAYVPSPGPDTKRETRLAVAREILRAERTTDRRGRPQYLASPIEPGQPLRVGEQVLVRLTLTAPKAIEYVMVEDPRVAGFEVDALMPDGVDRPYGMHAEEHDDRAAFFLSRIEEGETVIEYLVRPELAGTFTALPTEASGMYVPELRVRSGEAKVAVESKK